MAQISAIQMVSGADVEANLVVLREQISQLPVYEDHLVVLPECCLLFGCKSEHILSKAEELGSGYMQGELARIAAEYGIWLVAGTIPLKTGIVDKYSASCLTFNPQGKVISHYKKMHLFDVEVSDNTGTYLESTYTQAGNDIVVTQTEFANIGMSVCYDLRFPELFQALRSKKADVIVVPSAFTVPTGEAHWHALLRARAIETQCYIVAAAQGGVHNNGRETFGHSIIIDPWGEICDEIDLGQGFVTATMQQQRLTQIRRDMPIWQHKRL